MLFGGIEAGGTKFICAVADEQLTIIEKVSIPTTTPVETLKKVFVFFEKYALESIGVGSFGPIGCNPDKKDYGYILATPKKGWTNFHLLGELKKVFPIPIAWTTDVNAAAYGEYKKGAGIGKNNCLYLTVGTGIGGGMIHEGQIYTGLSHPEIGHIFVNRHPDDHDIGSCPYHKDCLEGLAAGPSLEARTRTKGELLPSSHEIWELQAYYIAQALVNYTLTFSPEIIILGGGVMNQEHLLARIRKQFSIQLNGYVRVPELEQYIVNWKFPNQSGIIGSLLLAISEFKKVNLTVN